ncbi:PhzF family phenazine biosynthesis protein [Ferrimonas marina]|uniref:Phenazine biosynthesis protein PhzF family n=1 Tax=Ferrimonas marina TaxID=299255 RepID=A0A1M5ZF33_9GAMM|nr:PhzF family phenazine biosynthesis protein [Ferrimonas marina]SHI22769.1 phenazine biosynthesis protein PhzF family [Ferrimonas marina]
MQAELYHPFAGPSAQGNPAAVVAVDSWPSQAQMQAISRALAQPVTTFYRREGEAFALRWFSQQAEINLCGHGSLAVAADIHRRWDLTEMAFTSAHGDLAVSYQQGGFSLVLPAWNGKPISPPAMPGIGVTPREAFTTRDLVLVLEDEAQLRTAAPDLAWLVSQVPQHALILTVAANGNGNGSDGYLLRYFAPKIGIDEDIATGSAQCSLAPYWFQRLNQKQLLVTQLSHQGGQFQVTQSGDDSLTLQTQVPHQASLPLP